MKREKQREIKEAEGRQVNEPHAIVQRPYHSISDEWKTEQPRAGREIYYCQQINKFNRNKPNERPQPPLTDTNKFSITKITGGIKQHLERRLPQPSIPPLPASESSLPEGRAYGHKSSYSYQAAKRMITGCSCLYLSHTYLIVTTAVDQLLNPLV